MPLVPSLLVFYQIYLVLCTECPLEYDINYLIKIIMLCLFMSINFLANITGLSGLSHYKLWVETQTDRADTVFFQVQFDAPVVNITVN